MIVFTRPPNDGKAFNTFVPASGTCFDIIRFINLLLAIVIRSQCGFSDTLRTPLLSNHTSVAMELTSFVSHWMSTDAQHGQW